MAALNPLSWFRRLRTTRGFGVHSPFAYRFITEVLALPHAYYAETAMKDRLLRIAFRTVLEVHPRRLAVYAPAVFGKVAKAAWSTVNVTPKRPDMVIMDAAAATGTDREQLLCDIASGASALVYNLPEATSGRPRGSESGASLAESLRAAMNQGMTFANTRGTIIAINRPLPRQDFTLNF